MCLVSIRTMTQLLKQDCLKALPRTSLKIYRRQTKSNPTFKELTEEANVIQRAFAAWHHELKNAKKRKHVHSMSKTQVARLRLSLAYKVVLGFRNQLKLLYFSQPTRDFPQGSLFSWLLRDFKFRMNSPMSNYLEILRESSDIVKQAVKVNAEMKTLIDITNIIADDIVYQTQYQGIVNIVSDMKRLPEVQNHLIKTYLTKEEHKLSLEDETKLVKEITAEDSFDNEAELLKLIMNQEVTKRHFKTLTQAQIEQVQFKTDRTEETLIKSINDYNQSYHEEKLIYYAIEKSDEQIIKKIEDEISVMTQKYEYECDELDLDIERRKNEISSVMDKWESMEKKFEEIKAEIGDQVAHEVAQPTVWSILEQLVEEENARKAAKLEAANQKKKGKKSKKSKS